MVRDERVRCVHVLAKGMEHVQLQTTTNQQTNLQTDQISHTRLIATRTVRFCAQDPGRERSRDLITSDGPETTSAAAMKGALISVAIMKGLPICRPL